MKQLFCLCLLLPLVSFSQKSFAPLGAVWNYEGKSEWNSSLQACSGNHLQYIVEAEVLIDGKDCSLIKAYHSTDLDTLWQYTGDSLIVWEDGDRIYFQEEDDFLLLFDFGLEAGFTFVRYDPFKRGAFSGTYYTEEDTVAKEMVMVVDKISEVTVNGQKREIKSLVYADPDMGVQKDHILDGVGSLSQSFAGDYLVYLANGCDGELICYDNSSLEYETPNTFAHPHPACDYSPFLDKVEDQFLFETSLFPNPFSEELNITMDVDKFSLKVLDLEGRVLISTTNQKQLNMGALVAGSYLLQIITNKSRFSKMIIKI